jgi:hypothetical protein
MIKIKNVWNKYDKQTYFKRKRELKSGRSEKD